VAASAAAELSFDFDFGRILPTMSREDIMPLRLPPRLPLSLSPSPSPSSSSSLSLAKLSLLLS
jgi:hypothetical protein